MVLQSPVAKNVLMCNYSKPMLARVSNIGFCVMVAKGQTALEKNRKTVFLPVSYAIISGVLEIRDILYLVVG